MEKSFIDSWDKMPVIIFQQITDINGLHISDDEKVLRCTALLAGMTYDEIISIPLSQTSALVQRAAFLYTEPKPNKVKKVYHIGEHDYNLLKNTDDMTTAAYIDYQGLSTQPLINVLPEVLSIALIPVGHKYNDGGYDKNEMIDEIANNLTVTEALGIANFFWRRFEKCIKRIALCSDWMMWGLKWKMMGSKQQREMYQALKLEMKLIKEALLSGYGFH